MLSLVVSLADAAPVDHTGLGLQANQQVSLYIGIVLPIIVALVTKKYADSSKLKAGLLLLLNLLNGFLTELFGTGEFHFWSAVNGTIISLITGVAALYGLYKPTGVSDALHNVLRSDDATDKAKAA